MILFTRASQRLCAVAALVMMLHAYSVSCAWLGCWPQGFGRTGKHKLVGERAPEFTLKSYEGEEFSLSDFRGKVVVISFFGTWSEQCGYYVSCLEKLYSTFGDNDLVVVAVTAESDCDTMKRYCAEHGITFPVLVGGREIFRQYKVGGIPDLLCVDTRGIVRYRTVGYKPETEDDLKTAVKILMEEIDLFTLR